MAYGKIKADAIIRDNGGSDEEITMATIVGLDSGKASLTGATFTGDVTLNAQQELRLADSDSSNYIAFASPATVSTNSTWTLPSDAPAAGEVLKVSSVSSNNPTLEWGEDVGGKILQIVQTVKTDTFSTNAQAGGSPAQITGLTANITPTTSGNKVLVMYNINVGQADNNWSVFLHLLKGGSVITGARGDAEGSNRSQVTTGGRLHNGAHMTNMSFSYLDTTSGTSQITYSVGMSTEPTSTGYVNRGGMTNDSVHVSRGASSITLFEIAQ